MKRAIQSAILALAWLPVCTVAQQARIFSLGYTKNYISDDSTNFTFTVDINRMQSLAEKGANYHFVNEEHWYFRPSLDINIGSGTKTAPNNISVGFPLGYVKDFARPKIMSLYLEASPDFVSDKTVDNFLYYLTTGAYLKYEYHKNVTVTLQTGLTVSNGRRAYSNKTIGNNAYGRLVIPNTFRFNFWNDSYKGSSFQRINFITVFKLSNIYKDNSTVTPDKSLTYSNTKFDLFVIPKLSITITYMNGYEEPLFQKVKSLSFGLSFIN